MNKEIERLQKEEKRLVGKIRKDIKKSDPDCAVVYLPNIIPKRKVEYIFITMEPSLGRWAKSEKEAESKIEKGFKNFIYSWEDFIVRFCINTYLSPSYYLTDISKAAMKVKNANQWRDEIYSEVKELLNKEIKIVGKKKCKLIPVGTKVEIFLNHQEQAQQILPAILHYSTSAARWRKRAPQENPKEFKEFEKKLDSKMIVSFAEEFLEENVCVEIKEWVYEKINNNKTRLSSSRKQLMFTYYKNFQNIKNNITP